MREVKTEILMRQPAYSLELQRYHDNTDEAQHAFVMHPQFDPQRNDRGITLLVGKGHDVSRRDIHYALYLFQKFHMQHAPRAHQA